MHSRSMSTVRKLDLSSSWCCFQARFEDTVQHLQLYRSYSSPSRSYIQLHRDSEPQVLKLFVFHAVILFSLCFHWQSDFLQVGQPLYLTLESNFNLTEFHYLVSIFDKAILHPFLRQKCNYWASTDKLCKRNLHVSINQSINQSINRSINKKSDKLFEGDFMMGLNSAILQII